MMPEESRDLPPLPEGLSSFGAAVHDGWLYVYSGHTGGAHDHSRENLSQRFQRLQLADGEVWEELPMQTPLQGLALVAHETGLYRIGGLNARNAPEEEEDLVSLAEFSQFDPQSGHWTRLADLPHARSSHDAVVIENRLYVAGGWTLGIDGGTWLDSALVFDLTALESEWESLPQVPFERRALTVSHWQGKLVVAGGIDSAGDISFSTDLYDPVAKIWSKGPRLPGEGMGAFGLSAWNLRAQLYLCGFGGIVYQLAADGLSWKEVLPMQTARFFHQLLSDDSKSLLAVAGASRRGHLTDIERLHVH
ncbi:MAG: hypothetical protein ABGX16_07060 [Pirellulales bacterium]